MGVVREACAMCMCVLMDILYVMCEKGGKTNHITGDETNNAKRRENVCDV
jgi:hypothetical protein